MEIRKAPSKELKAFEKRNKITECVLGDLKQNGLFFQTGRGCFYFSNTSAKLYPLEKDAQMLSAFIDDRFGLNRAEFREYDHLFNGLKNEALLHGQAVDIRQLAHYDKERKILYVSNFNGQMFRLNGKIIESISNGTDGVFFWDDPEWEPYQLVEQKPGDSQSFENLILASANLTPREKLSSEAQRWLWEVWMLAQFFDSLHPTKALLLICGEKGSGKTLALRKWMKLLFGSKAEVSALESGKSDGFVAAITSQPITIFDNVDEHINWLPDQLARLVSGVKFQRRKLYTTNEQAQFKPNCWVGLTSRTPKFVNGRDDVLDRMIILQAERFSRYSSEHDLLAKLLASRNLLWTQLLQRLNEIVGFFGTKGHDNKQVNFRMADIASFGLSLAESEGKRQMAVEIFARMEQRQTEQLLDNEPIYLCLTEWLKDASNHGRRVTSAELQMELEKVAELFRVTWPYSSPHSLGQRLSNILSNLGHYFHVTSELDTAKQRRYEFRHKAESLNPAESSPEEIQAVSPAVLAAASMNPESLNHF